MELRRNVRGTCSLAALSQCPTPHFALLRASLILLLVMLGRAADVAVASKATISPKPTPVSVDAVTCSMEECEPMCLCQKLLWVIDYNHPDAAMPTDSICVKWADEGNMKEGQAGETCLLGCLTIAQFIDAAAGRDPYICQRAVDAVTRLEEISNQA